MKDTKGFSSPHMMDDYVEKDNVDPQPNSDNFDQQTISPMQIDFETVNDVDEPTVEVEKQKVSKENVSKVCRYLILILAYDDLLCVSIP